MTTPIYELGDLVTIRKGKKAVEVSESPSEGFLRYIQIEDLRNNDSMKYARNPKGPICDENDVLIAWDGAKAGTVGFGLSGLIGSTIAILRTNESVHAPYLGMVLQFKYQMIRDACTGSTIPHVSKPFLLRMKIPLPSISEQKRIAAILEKANKIKQSSMEILRHRRVLLQSGFLEMFDEPSKSPKWPEISMLDLADGSHGCFVNGPFGSNLLTSELTTEGVPVCYIRDIREGLYNRVSTVFVTPTKAEQINTCRVDSGDVLIAKVGDPPGTAAIYPEGIESGVITQDLIRIRVNREVVSPHFLVQFLNSQLGHQFLKPIIVEATRSRFALGEFKKLKIRIPPIEMQLQFEEFVKSVNLMYDSINSEAKVVNSLIESSAQSMFN